LSEAAKRSKQYFFGWMSYIAGSAKIDCIIIIITTLTTITIDMAGS
jgi:hypothetical protein